mmetsp:Transcript_22051/g.33085  ORF Transcript_22051/g.33085 Transcript_22051/m.33085 type:complete len:402 (-) Transcript_22051:207-1412(-)
MPDQTVSTSSTLYDGKFEDDLSSRNSEPASGVEVRLENNENSSIHETSSVPEDVKGRRSIARTESIKLRLSNIDKIREKLYVLLAGILLSFNSGYINGACLSGFLTSNGKQVGVSAFTGTYTNAGLQLAEGEFDDFGFSVRMILCFTCGACISGAMNPNSEAYQLGPSYGPTFLIGSLFLVLACICSIVDNSHEELFYFAAAANGIQNGMSSMYSGNLIRSTHLTGTSTDIGLILGQMIRGNFANAWKCFILVSLATSFWLGGLISYFATREFESYSLIFNAVLFFAIGCGCILYLSIHNKISIWQAITGNWKWDAMLNAMQSKEGDEMDQEFLLGLFDRMDADGSGEIDEDELFEALKEAGLAGVTMKHVKFMMKAADDNGDGVISRDEWTALVKGINCK